MISFALYGLSSQVCILCLHKLCIVDSAHVLLSFTWCQGQISFLSVVFLNRSETIEGAQQVLP